MTPTIYLIILIHICISVAALNNTPPIPKVSALLIFGDSTVDSGNNNYIATLIKGNHLPYGQDFPGHIPTGRFSNGKLVGDFLASALKLKDSVPPYLTPNLSNEELLTGVCFASGGSGIDDFTADSVLAISLTKQIEYFKAYVVKLKQIVGENETKRILEEALVMISAGSNDHLKFYDLPGSKLMFNHINNYHDYLHDRLQIYIKVLYDNGCRKFGVGGLPPIGCLPLQITLKFQMDRKCVMEDNFDSEQYNRKLKLRLPQIQAMLPRSRIVYSDVYYTLLNLINHPQNYGIEVTNRGCCGLGLVEITPFCNEVTPLCSDASKYIFWDAFHLSEVSYQYLASYIVAEVLPQFN